MARKPYVFTPARAEALAKARLASARARHRRSKRGYSSDLSKRGQGVKGLKKNFTPYARINKRSQTVGANAGTHIPGTHKRIALGAYVRVENTGSKGAVDKAISKGLSKVAPHSTKRGRARTYLFKNVSVSNPAVRGNFAGGQVRLGTSRGAGPTIIVRRGSHKTPLTASRRGVQKFDTAKRKRRKRRPQRRR